MNGSIEKRGALSCSLLNRAGLGIPRSFIGSRRHPSALLAEILMVTSGFVVLIFVCDICFQGETESLAQKPV